MKRFLEKYDRFIPTWRTSFIFVAAFCLYTLPSLVRADGPTVSAPNSQAAGNPVSSGSIDFGPILENILWIFSWMVWFGGVILNASAYYSIVQMGWLLQSQPALLIAWGVFRDIGNVALIFGFIAMGVATMLDSAGYNAKKMLVTLIIVAVTINFSSLFARIVVDTGNILAIQFYKAFNGGSIPSNDFTHTGISNTLMDDLHLTTLYNPQSPGVVALNNYSNVTLIAFLGIMLFIIVTFVFLAIAIMFVTRFVILTLLITISPLAFVAMILPSFQGRAREWWDLLVKNTLQAPAVLLLLLIAVKVSNGLGASLVIGASFNNFAANWPNIILNFAFVIAFFVASLVVGKNLSSMGASFALNTSQKIVSYPFAKAARPMQRQIPKITKAYNRAMGSNAVGRFLSGSALDSAILGGLNKAANAKVGGYASGAESKKLVDERRKENDHIRGSDEKKKALSDAVASGDDKKISAALQSISMHDFAETEYLKEGAKGIEAIARNLSPEKFAEVMKDSHVSDSTKHLLEAERYGAIKTSNVKDYVTKDLEQFAKTFPKEFEAVLAARDPSTGKSYVTDGQLEGLIKSGVLSQDQRQLARDATQTGIVEKAVRDGSAVPTQVVEGMGPKQKAALSGAAITNTAVINTIDHNDMAAIMAENKLTGKQIDTIRNELLSMSATDPRRQKITDYLLNNQAAADYWGI